MTWENTSRRKGERRRRWHENRIASEPTEKRKLSAACDWLVSEAWKADRLEEVRKYVVKKVHKIRGEEADDDRDDGDERDDYAA